MKVKTKKSSLIYNPTAGALRRDPRQIDRLVSDLRLHGIEVAPLKTVSTGHATLLARQAVAEHAGVVIVCGGDG
ncbi:MAG: acylglycerol kinase family protein, partial [Blastocatellia bacterium]|nr:acylglycerol kinase family protein [Blastocatellia bacterium]